jgi:predicted transcriptional regulator
MPDAAASLVVSRVKPGVDPVNPTGWSMRYIDEQAGRIAEKLDYKPGGDLRAIVARLGGEVDVEPWDEASDTGLLQVQQDGRFKIWLSPFTVEMRDRFTIAHELGHFFLHAEAGKKAISIAREGTNRAEREADWFAVGFLLPQQEFIDQWKKWDGNSMILSSHFQVFGSVIASRKSVLESWGHDF